MREAQQQGVPKTVLREPDESPQLRNPPVLWASQTPVPQPLLLGIVHGLAQTGGHGVRVLALPLPWAKGPA